MGSALLPVRAVPHMIAAGRSAGTGRGREALQAAAAADPAVAAGTPRSHCRAARAAQMAGAGAAVQPPPPPPRPGAHAGVCERECADVDGNRAAGARRSPSAY